MDWTSFVLGMAALAWGRIIVIASVDIAVETGMRVGKK